MKTILTILAVVGLFAACTRTVYVPQTEVHTEYRDRVQYDSVLQHDSVFVLVKGDTVLIYKDRWRDRTHILRDTMRLTDSIPYPVEVVREVRHVPTIYRWSLWIALVAIGLVVWRVWRRIRM